MAQDLRLKKTEDISRKEDITFEEVRALDSFKDLDEQQIQNLIETIRTFSKVAYNLWSSKKPKSQQYNLTDFVESNQPKAA